MSSSSVKVAVRIRPMAAKEILANSTECVQILPGTQQLVVGGGPASGVGTDTFYSFSNKSFTFDHIFSTKSNQDHVYNEAVAPLVERFLEGFNATILAYGQTGSGKTYSMGIGLDSLNSASDTTLQGIVPRAITKIFNYIDEQKKVHDAKFSITVSFLELYNEELVDLLNPRPRSASQGHSSPSIREDGTGKIMWYNVLEESVNSPESLLSVLQRGCLCRTTGSTDMNASSSRSHAIFTVTLKQELPCNEAEGLADRKLISKFHFVDLAGSERLKRTNAEGDRKREGISINQGLLALGNVISALGDEARKSLHVPYRDSKLTRMLQDSLGGNSQTLMLACISPSDLNYGETVNTLHYANRARNIKNRVVINQEWGGSFSFGTNEREVKQLRATISQLRTEIAMIRAGTIPQPVLDQQQAKHLEQRENEYHQRRERDLLAEIQQFKSQAFTMQFNLDQARFYQHRFSEKCKQLSLDLANVSRERDTIMIEKARLLNPAYIKYREEEAKSKSHVTESASESIDQNEVTGDSVDIVNEQKEESVAALIQGFHQTIAQLKYQLSDAEDRLAWQREAMAKLGRQGKPMAWTEPDVELPKPVQKQIKKIKDTYSDEKHEQLLMHALRENNELRDALKSNDSPLDDAKGFLNLSKLQSEELAQPDDEPEEQDPDVYLLINKIQNDIAQHEALVQRIQRRDAEYEVMKKAYEQKLAVLSSQMSQFQVERDLALSKMQSGGNKARAKFKFDEEKKNLEIQIAEYRRKLGENSRLQTNNRSRSDMLTKELQATIEALKAEKTRMLSELRREAQKHRDMATASQREIAKLKRKERNATEATKRLERCNLIQRNMLKKRNEEVIKSQNKLKNVLSLLKRAATPNKIFKTIGSGVVSPRSTTRLPSRQQERKRTYTGPAMSEIFASANSPVRRFSIDAGNSEAVEIRAQFKKQMVEKELSTCVLCRRTKKKLDELSIERKKLVGEQKELIAERQRVVQAQFEQNQVYDADSPQYMDDRLQAIDVEISVIDGKMINLEDTYKRNMGTIQQENDEASLDISWENAVNILRSLDRIELELVVTQFLDDHVALLVSREDNVSREEEREGTVANLKRMIEILRTALYNQQSQQEEEPTKEEKPLEKSITRLPSITDKKVEFKLEKPRLQDIKDLKKPSISLKEFNPQQIIRSGSFPNRLADKADLETPIADIELYQDDKDEKKKLLGNGGVDVFERLANAHTLASQAKVINRSIIMEPEITDSP